MCLNKNEGERLGERKRLEERQNKRDNDGSNYVSSDTNTIHNNSSIGRTTAIIKTKFIEDIQYFSRH